MKHLVWSMRFAVSLMLCAGAYAQNGGLKFSLKDLGADLNNSASANESTAYAINNKGEVAGNARVKGETRCFYFPTAGGPKVFYVRNGSFQSCDARAIDAKGSVAGSVINEGNLWRAFRRITTGTLYTLEPPAPQYGSYGFGISNGTVVGYGYALLGYYYGGTAAKWDTSGALTSLLPGLSSTANGINASGQIVGQYQWFGLQLGFSMSNGSLSTLGTLGGNNSIAAAVNASGYILGSAQNAAGCWDVAVWFNSLPQDMGNCGGTPLAISGDNWIVGYNQVPWNPCDAWGIVGNCTAFLSTMVPYCGPVDLNTLLDASGTGWILKEATGINDSHQIVGYGVSPKGEHHAFLLTPNSLPLCYPD